MSLVASKAPSNLTCTSPDYLLCMLCCLLTPQNAPYKKRGKIPFGVQNGTYGLTAEEKMRRRWKEWSKAGSQVNGSGVPALAAAAAEPSYQVCRNAYVVNQQSPLSSS